MVKKEKIKGVIKGEPVCGKGNISTALLGTNPEMKIKLQKSKFRLLGEIVVDIKEYLRSRVWLSYEEDYTLLAMAVVVTYTQELFDAVPLISLTGPLNSGKSQLGKAMTEICCNSIPVVTTQMSAATVARLIDESRGFVVIDNFDVKVNKKDNNYNELVQMLKLSYNKHTAITTSVKGGRVITLNFYGVKLIINATGVDSVLGSRMLHIHTLNIPNEAIEKEFGARRKWTKTKLNDLRNEIHTWAFHNVDKVETSYRELSQNITDRWEEITVPLKVVSAIARVPEFYEELAYALQRQLKGVDNMETDLTKVGNAARSESSPNCFGLSGLRHMASCSYLKKVEDKKPSKQHIEKIFQAIMKNRLKDKKETA